MSVELPPLPEPFDSDRYFRGDEECRFDLYTADQMRAYATEALKARKPLTDEQIKDARDEALFTHTEDVFTTRLVRAIERAHGIGEQA